MKKIIGLLFILLALNGTGYSKELIRLPEHGLEISVSYENLDDVIGYTAPVYFIGYSNQKSTKGGYYFGLVRSFGYTEIKDPFIVWNPLNIYQISVYKDLQYMALRVGLHRLDPFYMNIGVDLLTLENDFNKSTLHGIRLNLSVGKEMILGEHFSIIPFIQVSNTEIGKAIVRGANLELPKRFMGMGYSFGVKNVIRF